MGVNSFVHQGADFGFASHVRHLRDMLATASDSVSPLPKGRSGGNRPDADAPQPNLAGAEMEKMFDECKGFGFSPTSAEQYAKLARLAGGMATATADDDGVATTLFGDMRGTTWSDDQKKAVNKFASDQVDKVNQGIFVFGKVQVAAENAVLMQVGDSKKFVFVQNLTGNVAGCKKDDTVLLVGLVTSNSVPVGMSQGGAIYARMINSRHMMKL
jgi:hypothetical protein